MIRFPPNIVIAVKEVIEANWPRGIGRSPLAHEFRLKGNPWTGQGHESVPARILMCVSSIGLRSLNVF